MDFVADFHDAPDKFMTENSGGLNPRMLFVIKTSVRAATPANADFQDDISRAATYWQEFYADIARAVINKASGCVTHRVLETPVLSRNVPERQGKSSESCL